MRILIADDSSVVRQRLGELLADITGIEGVDEAEDAEEALYLFSRFPHDVVILDIRMPKGNGLDVLRRIKAERPATCVVLLTNFPCPLYFRKAREAGADFFFDKSREFERVAGVIKEQIKRIPPL